MLGSASPIWAHRAQNLALILLSLLFLPIDTFVTCIVLLIRTICGSKHLTTRDRIRQDPNFQPRRILVTGVGMTKGLVLAKIFFKAGHDVIGADFESPWSLVCGRTSKALSAFYPLTQPNTIPNQMSYVAELKNVILREKVELWVSCSGVVSAIEDGYAKEVIENETNCVAIQFNKSTTAMLHEKDSFVKHVQHIGLKTPVTHRISNLQDAETILKQTPENMRYILKAIGVNDASRGNMTPLPRTTSQETNKYLSKLEINEANPWILQELVDGKEYCTQALIVRGKVKYFVACPSTDLLMHYEALPPDSILSIAMLKFTQIIASYNGLEFTGHLSFDFLVRQPCDSSTKNDVELYPIECNPRCHTAIVLFQDSCQDVCKAYLSALKPDEPKDATVLIPKQPYRYHWIGHSFVNFCCLPVFKFCLLKMDKNSLLECFSNVALQFLLWKDGTFEYFDPLPWWWLYHVYWPLKFAQSFCYGNKWSRVNVSTTKMFAC